ncbi:hypothetical protein [Streptomyces sp. NBC_00728]|uniref:hypothetical protein n=1 Tax=Streptomyces sp. NBC_00728 TaxID=2903676 RepID=UPI00386A2CA2
MTTAHAWRSASQGLLERRRSASGADGCYARRTAPARPADGAPRFPANGAPRFPANGAPWFPEAPLPPGLLPLPSGFEPRGA